MLGIIKHDLFLRHLEGYDHVESPNRLKYILDHLGKSPLAGKCRFIEAEPARIEWLEMVHDRQYIDDILSLKIDQAVILDWGDTVATPATPQAALYAAGAGIHAAVLILDGKLDRAFCAVRPPGHHAERKRAMGFCIFNNIAVTAAYLTEIAGLDRVAVIDWDIHHGNGTERMFEEDDRVLYISLHQFPHYPGTGSSGMTGIGKGDGFTINLPIGEGADDDDYRAVFHDHVIPAVDNFQPEFILISAGFDAHRDDPLSGTRVTTPMFGEMTAMLRETAERHCRGRMISLLEGGYNLTALAESVEKHLEAMI
nr:histone deacetylase [candidate division Zixibacteria bacterium]